VIRRGTGRRKSQLGSIFTLLLVEKRHGIAIIALLSWGAWLLRK